MRRGGHRGFAFGRRRWSRLVFAVALLPILLVVRATPAHAASDAVSTLTKLGSDTLTSSTAFGGGPPGATTAGHTINWVLSYTGTPNSPDNTTIADPITGGQTYVTGSLKTPPDLAPAWSTNDGASFSPTQPASGVNELQASGVTLNDGVVGPASPPLTGFAVGSVNGDGWSTIFIGSNIYNIHHHRTAGANETTIECHVRVTGAECPGYPALGHYVSATAGTPFSTGPDTLSTAFYENTAVNQATGEIYFAAGVNGTTSVGVGCANVLTNTSCGYTQLATSDHPNSFSGNEPEGPEALTQISGGAQIGTKYYTVGNSAHGPIYCFDYSTGAVCPGYPIASDPALAPTSSATGLYDNLESWGGYLFATFLEPNNSRDLTCVNTATNAVCPGFPIVAASTRHGDLFNEALAPILDANGNVTGICLSDATGFTAAPYACYGLTGASLGGAPWGQLVPGDIAGQAAVASPLVIGTDEYFAYMNVATGAATYACYDSATASPCAGFVQASTGTDSRPYTLREDPNSPDCLWELGDAGVFETFSKTFGGTSCSESTTAVTAAPASEYCDGKSNHVRGWSQLALEGLSSSQYSAIAVTITDASGNPVPGWDDTVISSGQLPIDISSIPYSGSTTELNVTVLVDWTANTAPPAYLAVTWNGDPQQVCFQTVVNPDTCAGATAISNAATSTTTALIGGATDAPAGLGSGTAAFNLASGENQCWNLGLTKTAQEPEYVLNRDEIYHLTVTNFGPGTPQSVVVSDRLPSGLTFVSASPSGCTAAGAIVTCTLASLSPNASYTFTIVTHVNRSARGILTNVAIACSDKPVPSPSGTASNCVPPVCGSSTSCGSVRCSNSASATKPAATGAAPTEACVSVPPYERLKIQKRASQRTVTVGALVTFTITTGNATTYPLHNVQTCDTLPLGLQYVSSRPHATLHDGKFCWTAKTLGTHPIKYRITARALLVFRTLVNTATATAKGVPMVRGHATVRVIARHVPPPTPVTG